MSMSESFGAGQNLSGMWSDDQRTVMPAGPEQPAPLSSSVSSGDAIQPAPSPESVREQICRMTASQTFVRSKHLCRFLNFTAGEVLCGQATGLKECVIGITVFDRGASFDPSIDPIVRVQARRLRQKLVQYYAAEGQNDRVLIEMPPGGYVPVFRERTEFATRAIQPEIDTSGESNEVREGTTEALELCRTALSISRQSGPSSIEESIRCYERALEIDPNCAPAYAALTVMHMMKGLLERHADGEQRIGSSNTQYSQNLGI